MNNFLKENLLGIGSSRIVFDNNDGTVTKIPLSPMGLEANKLEYNNALKYPEIVANAISFDGFYFIQEKLTDLKEYSYDSVLESTVLDEVKVDYPEDTIDKFSDYVLLKKFCIGRDSNGVLKQYDYEDIKAQYKGRENEKPESYLGSNDIENDFFEYQKGINNLQDLYFNVWYQNILTKQLRVN